MRIGTDVSLQTCMDEGYTVMDYAVRKLFPRGRKNGIDKDCQCSFSASWPLDCRSSVATPNDPFGMRRRFDTTYSWNDLLERYGRHKAGIDSCCDFANCSTNFENPTEWDMLHLADCIAAYCGLE